MARKKQDRSKGVRCRTHGWMKGYIMCRHIVHDGASVDPAANYEPGDPAGHPDLGQRFCTVCAESAKGSPLDTETLVLVCYTCACAKGWAGDQVSVH